MTETVILTGTVLPDSDTEKRLVEQAGPELETIDVSSKEELVESATDPIGIMTIETDVDESVMEAFPSLEFVPFTESASIWWTWTRQRTRDSGVQYAGILH